MSWAMQWGKVSWYSMPKTCMSPKPLRIAGLHKSGVPDHIISRARHQNYPDSAIKGTTRDRHVTRNDAVPHRIQPSHLSCAPASAAAG